MSASRTPTHYMDTSTLNAPAESSAAAPIEVPSDATSYNEWRQTGKLPNAESAPATKSSDAKPKGDAEGNEESRSAPESEPGKRTEHKPGKAEARLNELLEDLRKAGLSPAELKTFKREAQKAADESQPKKSEPTVKPVDDKAPKKPKDSDYQTWEEFEAAKDEYLEAMADYKAQKRLEKFQADQRQAEAEKAMTQRLNEAKVRYKDDSADQTIVSAAKAIFTPDESPVPAVIREVLNESDHLVDVLYTLGRDAEALGEFLELCTTSPGKALRKAVLVEKLVMEELGSGKAEAGGTPERGSNGKFVKAPKETKAPPPPKETSGRSSAPADETERAIESGDFTSYRAAANRRDLARLQGR